MDDLKTFEDISVSGKKLDSLYAKQKEGVANMRASLLACADNPTLAADSIKRITNLRIYHQISRIIRYLELMDKLEDKLYQSIDANIETADIYNDATIPKLMAIQTQLQKTMIQSHQLLQPYLELQDFNIQEFAESVNTKSTVDVTLDASSREKIRNGAQALLKELDSGA